MKDLLSSYKLLNKLIVYVKYEGGSMSNFTQTINFMVKCVPLVHVALWLRSCFCHFLVKHVNMFAMISMLTLTFERLI